MKKRRILIACTAVTMAGCSSPSTNDSKLGVASSEQPITTLSEPCAGWEGTTVELLLADAYSGCAIAGYQVDDYFVPFAENTGSWYVQGVLEHVAEVVDNPNLPSQLGGWHDLREDPVANCDPETGATRPAVTLPEPPFVADVSLLTLGATEHSLVAAQQVRLPSFHLCVAQALRDASVQATGVGAYSLSAVEQVELLEAIRGEAQQVALQLASISSILVAPEDAAYASRTYSSVRDAYELADDQTLPELQAGVRWISVEYPGSQEHQRALEVLTNYGDDLAAAVQLHVAVTEELLRLYARNRSAEVPSQFESPSSRAEALWGPGSWHHRMLHLAYGGDPLYMPDGGPWQHPTRDWSEPFYTGTHGDMFVRPGRSGVFGTGASSEAPSAGELPYVTQPLEDPGIGRLYAVLDEAGGVPYVVDSNTKAGAVQDTADLLYARAEEYLRVANGLPPTPIPTNPDDRLLWSTQRITREHAETLAAALADVVGYGGFGCTFGARSAMNLRGEIEEVGTYSPGEIEVRLSQGAQLVPRRVTQMAAYASRTSRLYMNEDVIPLDPSTKYGLPVDSWAVAEDMRRLGALSSLQLLRHKLARAYLDAEASGDYRQDRAGDILAHVPEIVRTINGAIGNEGAVLHSVGSSGRQEFTVTAASDDGFWQVPSGDIAVCLLDDNVVSSSLLVEREGVVADQTLTDAMRTCADDRAFLVPVAGEVSGVSLWVAHYAGGWFNDLPPGQWSLVAWNADATTRQQVLDGALDVDPSTVRHLVSYVDGDTYGVQGFAFGGMLGGFVARQSTPLAGNPAEPAYDGFDLPTGWLPPASATLMGGEEGQSSVPFLLNLARASAEDSANAVDDAVQHLLAVERDEITAASEAKRAQQQLYEAAALLCGRDNAGGCEVDTTVTKLDPGWYASLQGYVFEYDAEEDCGALEEEQAIDCGVEQVISRLLEQEVQLAEPVASAAGGSSVPTFGAFAGGELQAALIEQFRAVHAPDGAIASLLAARDALKAKLELAEEAYEDAALEEQEACGAVDDNLDLGLDALTDAISSAWPPNQLAGAWNRSRKRTKERKERCRKAQEAAETAEAAAMVAFLESLEVVVQKGREALDLMAAIAQSGAEIEKLKNQTELAGARIRLEEELAVAGLQTSSGLYRRYHSYDVWRANALLENARRLAHAARRSIEARYVVDLSRMNASEAFVASPALWANEVYEYDLSLPAAVGLQVSSGGEEAIFGNKVVDYVRNLENFVAGYAVTRPSAAGVEDIDVLNLSGLTRGTSLPVGELTYYPNEGNWTVLCPATQIRDEQWLPVGVPGGVEYACVEWQVDCEVCLGVGDEEDELNCARQEGCLVQPIAARLSFTVDAWGRLAGSFVDEPYDKRYNARWSRLAVNFVGTGIRDCSRAADPPSCYGEGFIRYDLVHIGPSYVTDYNGSWHLLQVPTAFVEAGKGLAAELWLDPLKDGWSTEYIAPVARTEFAQRPLDGAYEITVNVTPEIRLERIERVQILQGSEYWVAQQY